MRAFVICANRSCGFSEGFDDIRDAPSSCPKCSGPLVTECPSCGAFLRDGTGICSTCRRDVLLPSPSTRVGHRAAGK